MDAHKNFAYSTVAVAPIPPDSGLSLEVVAGQGARFPAPPFNVTIWSAGTFPVPTNAEIARVTSIVGDVFTIIRAQESSNARNIVAGDQIAATITDKTLDDLSTPTGIVNAQIDAAAGIEYSKLDLAGQIQDSDIVSLEWSKLTSKPTSLAGYGITDPVVLTSGSYANPAWLTSLGWAKITGTPTTIGGYGITDAQPLNAKLTTLSALANAAGVLTNDGAGVFSWVAGGAGLSGSGTSGKIAKWSGASTLTDSILSEAGSVVTVNGDLVVRTSTQSMLLSSKFAVGRVGLNVFIGGGGQSIAGATGNEGSENAAVGNEALLSLTSGYFNTAVGASALRNETTGFQNVAIGYRALFASNTGNTNVAIGYEALRTTVSGSSNVAVGVQALYSNTATANTAIGYQAGHAITSAIRCVAIGMQALFSNQTSSYNIAIGQAAAFLTTGGENTAVGSQALNQNTTGSENSAFGMEALYNSTGIKNTGIGRLSLQNVTSGSNNTALGYRSGLGITTGGSNTIIGANVVGLSSGLSNTVIIADGAGNIRLHANSFGNVGVGITNQTAVLHLKAGTATANTAPLKFTSGTLTATAEAGAVEFLTDDVFITITTAAARKAFVLDNGSRLTSGKIPVATTNGRLIDGPTWGARETYTVLNVTTDRSYDANATSLDELADVLGTLIADLRAKDMVA